MRLIPMLEADGGDPRLPSAAYFSMDTYRYSAGRGENGHPGQFAQRLAARRPGQRFAYLQGMGTFDLLVGAPDGRLDPERVIREQAIPCDAALECTTALAAALRARGITRVDGFLTNLEVNAQPIVDALFTLFRHGTRRQKIHLPPQIACWDGYALDREGDLRNQLVYTLGNYLFGLVADYLCRAFAPLAAIGPCANSHAGLGGGGQRWWTTDTNGWSLGCWPPTVQGRRPIHAPQCYNALGPRAHDLLKVSRERDPGWYVMLLTLDTIGAALADGWGCWPVIARSARGGPPPPSPAQHRCFLRHVEARLARRGREPTCWVFNPRDDGSPDPLDELVEASAWLLKQPRPRAQWKPEPVDLDATEVRSGEVVTTYDDWQAMA